MKLRHVDEPLLVALIRLVVAAGSAVTTIVLVGELAEVGDTVMRAFGLGLVSVLTVGLILQVRRWRPHPSEDADPVRTKEWREPRTLAIAGWFLGMGLFLVPSPTTHGWAIVPIVLCFVLAATLARMVLFAFCTPARPGTDGATEPAGSAEEVTPILVDEPTVSRPVLAGAVVLVVLLVIGIAALGGKESLTDVFASGRSTTPTAPTPTAPTTTSTTEPVAPSTTTTDPPEPAPASDGTYGSCLALLIRVAPEHLLAAWRRDFDHWGPGLSCPDSAVPTGRINGYYFKGAIGAAGEYVGDEHGNGAFVFEPLPTQLRELLSDLDLTVMGGAPTSRADCATSGNIVVFVDEERRPRGVALRDRKTDGQRAQTYTLVTAADFPSWWRATTDAGAVQLLFPILPDPGGPQPTTVDDVLAYC